MTQTSQTTSSTISSAELGRSLDVIEIKPGLKFSHALLKEMLPDVETIFFFGKVYNLDHIQVSNLLKKLVNSDLSDALFNGSHSEELQDYLLDLSEAAADYGSVSDGDVTFEADVPHGEILPEMWKSLEIDIASSIGEVAEKLAKTVGMLPGKQGSMVFKSMMQMNRLRPTMGVHKATIEHARQAANLVILDVSSSMSRNTVARIVDDVVALSYMADAHFAVVSDTTTTWEPGSYSVDDVMRAAEFMGTHYETLQPLLNRDWGTVICIADYDSSASAKASLAKYCTGSIELVLDISLVSRPTYLAECVGQLAKEVRPMLVGTSDYVLT